MIAVPPSLNGKKPQLFWHSQVNNPSSQFGLGLCQRSRLEVWEALGGCPRGGHTPILPAPPKKPRGPLLSIVG